MQNSGIYKILNGVTEKFYIGSAVKINIRFKGHKYKLRHNKHDNVLLQNSWNLHGEQVFTFEILEYCDKNELIDREQYWLDQTKSYEKEFGYNINKFANSRLGMKHTEETKLKFKNRVLTDDHKSKLRTARLGTSHTIETKTKMSIASKGKNKSEEHKSNLKKAFNTLEMKEIRRLAKLGKIGNRKSEKWPHPEGHWRCKCDACKKQRNEYSKLNLRKNRAKRKTLP